MDIQARSDERRTGTDDEGIPTMSTTMFFEAPAGRRPVPGES
jgi:hypothetical protein